MEKLLDLFQRNVAEAPEAPFLYDDAHPRGITFQQADELSGRVYAWLKGQGIGREDFVLIHLPRGILPFVAAIGVWKAGAAFVIAEENYAPERVSYIRNDCGCKAEVNRENLETILQEKPRTGREDPDLHDAAFAVYTSGTTGLPKGVLHEYGNLERCVASLQVEGNPLLCSGNFRVFTAPQSFVAAVIGLISVMAADHARMYVVSYETAKNPEMLKQLFEEYGFNMLFLSPSYARILAPTLGPYLRTMVVGSEPAGNLYFPIPNLLNLYATSESLFLISTFRLNRVYEKAPVGKPAFPLEIRLLDAEGKAVENGEIGEIVYDNPYVRGYINRPEETKEVFSEGWFHSGDLARRDPEGNLVILGRANDMVKINGNRVEPGEIESVVRKLLGIDWAAARAFTDEQGRGTLCVYYQEEIAFDPAELRARMMNYLPYYMIPSHFIRVEQVPLLPNGKLNRKALPEPEPAAFQRDYAAPTNETEAVLCAAFERILGIGKAGIRDDFYELGGDSLRSILLVMDCGLPGLSATEIFRGRTPEKIAALYQKETARGDGLSPEEQNRKAMAVPHPLTDEQLYMLDYQLYTPLSTMYNLFAALRIEKDTLDLEKLAEAVGQVIQNHPSLLTTIFFTEEGKVAQRYTPEKFEKLFVERCTEAAFQELKNTLVQPYKMVGERLYRCRVFETEACGYLFFDVHHIVFDGGSFRVLMKEIAAAYAGEQLGQDLYYLLLENRESQKKSALYAESRAYFEKKYGGYAWSSYPVWDHASRENVPGMYAFQLPIAPERLARAEQAWHVSRNEFFITAAALAIACYNQTDHVRLSWIYHGREESSLLWTTGLLFRDLPVGLILTEGLSLKALFTEVKKQVRGGIEHSIYPYVERNAQAMSNESAYLLYQQDLRDPVRIGGTMLRPISVRQNHAASQTILDIQVLDGAEGLTIELDYAAALYEKTSMERFGILLSELAATMVNTDPETDSLIPELLAHVQHGTKE